MQHINDDLYTKVPDKNIIFPELLLFAQILAVTKKFCILTKEQWVQDEWAHCIACMKYILRVLGHSIA